MPENNNRGKGRNDDIEAYLDLLDSESGNRRKVSRDFSNLNETLSHEKASDVRFIDIEEEETIRRPPQKRTLNNTNNVSQRVNSQRPVGNTGNRKPAPPRYKENGKFVDAEERKKQNNC